MSSVDQTIERVDTKQRFLALVGHEFRYDRRIFWRNTQSRFFTLALPVFLLVLFASVFKGQNVAVPGGRINESVYYVPGLIVFGLIAATLSNLTVTIVGNRESGIYKRRRATPVPAGAVIAGRALVGVLVALVLAALLLVIGWAGYGASIPGKTAPAFVLDIVVGAVVFCCLGFALASVINNADAAQPVVQAIVLPLCFISGVFIPYLELPHWLVDIGSVFPVRPLAAAMLAAYNPHTTGSGLRWGDLLVLAAWGVGGLLIAIRRFSWLPRGG
jgi:ABC-2 type transport system permease protein